MSMKMKFPTQDDSKLQEPSILSLDAEERKQARKMRIQKRSEAMLRQTQVKEEEITQQTQTEKQIDTSNLVIAKLVTEGDEVISNIRVANDAREIARREEDIVIRNALLNELENEAKEAAKKFEEISSKWSSILESKDPLDINAGIQSQNAKCLEISAEKDIIIAKLKRELDNADQKFVDDQKNQNEDINILVERIDNQTNIISKAYRRELSLIEDVLKNERTNILQNITERWNELYEKRKNDEMNGVERRREIMREYEKEMDRVLIEYQEKYRAQKIWLESEYEKLQQEVEKMKALCMFSAEKLDYSYEILKRREDENKIVKNLQRRRINKLQDTVSNLKKNCADLEENSALQVKKLEDQVTKAHKTIRELESKSNHFTTVNERQYMQIWEMDTKNADNLLNEVLKVDKIVYEQILGLEWEPPKLTPLKKDDLPSYQNAMSLIEKQNKKKDKITRLRNLHGGQSSPETINLERKMLAHILTEILDQTGFLIEDKMRERLSDYSQINQTIIRLDNVFQALNIQAEDEVYLLLQYFLPHAYCPLCELEGGIASSTVGLSDRISECENLEEPSCPRDIEVLDEPTGRLMEEIMKVLPSESKDEIKREDKLIESSEDSCSTSQKHLIVGGEKKKLTCGKGHLLQIESDNVIKALREFVERCNEVNENENSLESNYNKITISRSISEKDVTEYWQRYREIFSSDKEKLWDALLIGLDKYHEILKERQKLLTETESLRQQNSELRRLLETCNIKSNICTPKRGTRSVNNKTP